MLIDDRILQKICDFVFPGSPKKVPYDYLHMRLSELEGVKSVHSLKIWSLTSNEVNASVHLAVGKCCCCETFGKSCWKKMASGDQPKLWD